MGGHNPKLKEILKRVDHLAPVSFIVNIDGPIAVALCGYAMACNVYPETIIAEALRVYLGDA